ncbi:MAG: MMPL family transporter [Dehalococcoidia bacterium]|nr:MMPL family transporter [Dehalococcoidia bacterium]
MFSHIGSLAVRLRFAILAAALAVVALGLTYGSGVSDDLESGSGLDAAGSDSFEVQARLVDDLGLGEADVVAVFGDSTTSVDDPAFAASVQATLDDVARQERVVSVTSIYNGGSDALVSFDRSQTFAVISLAGNESAKIDALPDIEPALRASTVPVQLGGYTVSMDTAVDQLKKDLRRAELLAFIIVAVLLVIVFGSLVGALLPLLIGGLSVLTTMAALRLIAQFTDVNVFVLNIVIMLGLGLSIDYSLLVVNRYREELGKGLQSTAAILRTLTTAGKAVVFSGLTVAGSMMGLFLFPHLWMRSMALGGALVAFIAVVSSLTVLPALLAVLGPRVNAVAIRRAWIQGNESAFWSRLANWVMRRPIVVAATVTALLIVVALPFLRVQFTTSDSRILGEDTEPRRVFELLRDGEHFPPNETTPIQVLVDAPSDVLAPENVGALFDYVTAVEDVRGVQRVDSIVSFDPSLGREEYQALYSQPINQLDLSLTPFVDRFTEDDVTLVSAVLSSHFLSDEALDATEEIQGIRPAGGLETMVGGSSAAFLDSKDAFRDRLPFTVAFIALVTFGALFVVSRASESWLSIDPRFRVLSGTHWLKPLLSLDVDGHGKSLASGHVPSSGVKARQPHNWVNEMPCPVAPPPSARRSSRSRPSQVPMRR